VRGDGTVWSWGLNNTGQLGDGTHTDHPLPAQISGLTGVRRVGAGAYFSFAQLQDGTLKGWGHNYFGELGDGTNLERAVPVAIPGIADVVAVTPGSGFTLALRADYTVWSTGQNVAGQLGNGTTTPRLSFGPVLNLPYPIWSIAAGEDHSLAKQYNSELYGWARTSTARSAPTPITHSCCRCSSMGRSREFRDRGAPLLPYWDPAPDAVVLGQAPDQRPSSRASPPDGPWPWRSRGARR
jgi:alpha-tubulin suppressor-like RCC1 family protein